MSKSKYKFGRQIKSVAEFEKSTCTFFKVGMETTHRGWIESWQYRYLKQLIESGNLREAELIEEKQPMTESKKKRVSK